jgi:hypothetical protein
MPDYWQPAPIWRGKTVFIVGGGPSLLGFDFGRLRGRSVIAVNRAAKDVPWADALLFRDQPWFDANRALVAAWPGHAFTTCPQSKAALPEKMKLLATAMRADFLPGTSPLKRGRSGGQMGISLAIAANAAAVVLLGFDMRLVAGRSHYHDDYRTESERLYRNDFLRHFEGWNAAAQRAGVDVINATPGSALDEFRRGEIDQILA